MLDLPTSWDGLHPLVVHFPIALLLVAPVFIVLGIALRERGRPMLASSLILMVLGTVALFVAVSTGEAAGEFAERLPTAESLVERHEELAETARTLFAALTLIFAAWLVIPVLLKRDVGGMLTTSVNIAFLVAYLAASAVLVNAAHEGGRLVHEFGLHSHSTPAALTSPAAPAATATPDPAGEAGNLEDNDE
jgi:uncharacterized membrane protein